MCLSAVGAQRARELDEAHNAGPMAIAELELYERTRGTLQSYGQDCVADGVIEKTRRLPTLRERTDAC